MMTNIAIMTNDGSTEFPRPWNRASSPDELVEMVAYYISYHTGKTGKRALDLINLDHIDLDAPIARINLRDGKIIHFFAFTESF